MVAAGDFSGMFTLFEDEGQNNSLHVFTNELFMGGMVLAVVSGFAGAKRALDGGRDSADGRDIKRTPFEVIE
ncbi:hypothetical protein BC835DRAFT_1417220 [Cytidiella melzeri]|nr:hypothetical protein BC835DRAFT_1417220 [Cytidiella melzeri]